MPPKHGLERSQKKKEKLPSSLESEKYPLAVAVLFGRHGVDGVENEFECERRYLPSRELSLEELEKLSGGHKREIEQCYVKTDAGTVRLRKTFHESEEGELYRIAHKQQVPMSQGKIESQIKFPPNDPRAKEFEELWEKHSWNIVKKTRYYIPCKLPNGNMSEIHYDIHHAEEGDPLDGFVRIEVEFRVESDAKSTSGNRTSLPNWIGQEVTYDEQYNGKEIAKKGIQKSL